jgi:hypothetical protein
VKVCTYSGRVTINAMSQTQRVVQVKVCVCLCRLLINAVCQKLRVPFTWKFVLIGAVLTINAVFQTLSLITSSESRKLPSVNL